METGNHSDDDLIEELEQGVTEWLSNHEPLSRSGLQSVESTFMRTVGEPARMDRQLPEGSRATEKNPHMRVASPEEFGLFAYQEDVVLIELDETIECGEMVGYPAGQDGWAPVLICVDGPVPGARTRVQTALMTIQDVAEGDVIL